MVIFHTLVFTFWDMLKKIHMYVEFLFISFGICLVANFYFIDMKFYKLKI